MPNKRTSKKDNESRKSTAKALGELFKSILPRVSQRYGTETPCSLPNCDFLKVASSAIIKKGYVSSITFFAPDDGTAKFAHDSKIGTRQLCEKTAESYRSGKMSLCDVESTFWPIINKIEQIPSCVGFATEIEKTIDEIEQRKRCEDLHDSDIRQITVHVFLSALATIDDKSDALRLLGALRAS